MGKLCASNGQETEFPDNGASDCGCMDCMSTAAQAFPSQSWSLIVSKITKPGGQKFKQQFFSARAVAKGEEESTVAVPCAVVNAKQQGVETYVKYALLTEAEFTDVLLVHPSAVQVKSLEWTNEQGETVQGFLVSGRGCPAEVWQGLRKIKVYNKVYLDLNEQILRPDRQVTEGQGQELYDKALEEALKQRPTKLKANHRWRVQHFGALSESGAELQATLEAELEAEQQKADPATNALQDLPDMAPSSRRQQVPTTFLGSLSTKEKEEADGKSAKKKRKAGRSPSPTRSSQVGISSTVGEVPETENLVFLKKHDPDMVPVWKLYCQKSKGNEPRSLLMLDAQKHLDGEFNAEGRTTDGAGRVEILESLCPLGARATNRQIL